MRNRKKRILCLFICLATLLALSGCSKGSSSAKIDTLEPMEVEEVYKYSLDLIGGDDVMPIGAYYGPTMSTYSINGLTAPSTLTDEFYQSLVDAGINYLPDSEINYAARPELNQKVLELSHKYGVATFIKDTRFMDSEITKEGMLELVLDYVKHPGFTGVFLYDEVGTPEYVSFRLQISELENLANLLNNELEVGVYNNAVGMQAWGEQARVEYSNYIAQYVDKMEQKFLLYTCYPGFDPEDPQEELDESKKEYFWMMANNRQYAEDNKIPFWSHIGTGSQWNYLGNPATYKNIFPVEGDYKWNINTKLSFGMKGLVNFIGVQTKEYAAGPEVDKWNFEVNGIFGYWGNKNRWYYYAKDMNAHIAAIDSVLMNAKSKGVIVSGEKATDAMKYLQQDPKTAPALIQGTEWRELKDVEGEAIVGCFNYQGKTALYVTNYLLNYSQKVDLHFTGNYKMTIIQDAETSYRVGSSITLDMAAGDGVLIVFD